MSWLGKLFPWRDTPGPHGWKIGLKDAPLHLVGFGVPFGVAAHFIPPPWNFVVLGGLGVWRGVEEYRDHAQGHDTVAKAAIDFATQVAGGIVGALV